MTTSVKEEVKQDEQIALELASKIYNTARMDTNPAYRGALAGLQYRRSQNHELLEALREVIEKCDGVTNPPCYIDSILFSKIKTLISKSNINEQ